MKDDLVKCPQYALYFAIDMTGSVVKIGHTWNPKNRWDGIRYPGYPRVRLDRYIVIVPESGDLTERNLLDRFAKYRISPDCTEWFHAVPEIMDLANSLLPGISKAEFDTPAHRAQIQLWKEQKAEREAMVVRLLDTGSSSASVGEQFGMSNPLWAINLRSQVRGRQARAEGMSWRKIADEMGLPMSTIRTALAKGSE